MGRPGLVARDAPDRTAVCADRGLGPGTQRSQVGAGVRFGKRRGRDDLAADQAGKQIGLLRGRAVEQNQFAGDFGARAERPKTDPASRQFFGHDAHRGLAQPGSTPRLRDGQPEDAEFAQFGNDCIGDQLIAKVPSVGRLGMVIRPACELRADFVKRAVFEAGIAERTRGPAFGDQRRNPGAHRRCEAFGTK